MGHYHHVTDRHHVICGKHVYFIVVKVHKCTGFIAVACAMMGGARSPMMTKKAMQVPKFRPITLQGDSHSRQGQEGGGGGWLLCKFVRYILQSLS